MKLHYFDVYMLYIKAHYKLKIIIFCFICISFGFVLNKNNVESQACLSEICGCATASLRLRPAMAFQLQFEAGEITGIFRFHVCSVREFLTNRVDIVTQVYAEI